MRNKSIGIMALFAVLGVALLCAAAPAGAGEIRVTLNVVSGDRVVIYAGSSAGIVVDAEYDVITGDGRIGGMKAISVKGLYTVGRILDGDLAPKEGRIVTLRIAEKRAAREQPKNVAPVADDAGKREKEESVAAVEKKPESGEGTAPARASGRSARAKKTDTESETTARKETETETESGDNEKESAEEPRETGGARRKKSVEKESERPDVEIVRPEADNTTERMSVQAPERENTLVNTLSAKVETHSDDGRPDAAGTMVLAASRRQGNMLQTLYGMFSAGFPRSSEFDIGGMGVSFTVFMNKLTYVSAGYNKVGGEGAAKDSLSFSWDRLLSAGGSKDKITRVFANYIVNADLDSGESWTLGLKYSEKRGEKAKVALSYRYIYSVDASKHLYNQYNAEYSEPMGTGAKLTLGYKYLDKVNAAAGAVDHDDSFYATWLYMQ